MSEIDDFQERIMDATTQNNPSPPNPPRQGRIQGLVLGGAFFHLGDALQKCSKIVIT